MASRKKTRDSGEKPVSLKIRAGPDLSNHRFTRNARYVVVSLALNSVAEFHGYFSGILGPGIIGGAVAPVIVGRIGDYAGLRSDLAFLYVSLG